MKTTKFEGVAVVTGGVGMRDAEDVAKFGEEELAIGPLGRRCLRLP